MGFRLLSSRDLFLFTKGNGAESLLLPGIFITILFTPSFIFREEVSGDCDSIEGVEGGIFGPACSTLILSFLSFGTAWGIASCFLLDL